MFAKSRFLKGINMARSYVFQKIDDPLILGLHFFFQKLKLISFKIKSKFLNCWFLNSHLGFMRPIDSTFKVRSFLSFCNT